MATKKSKNNAKSGRGIYISPVLVGMTREQHESVKAAAARAQRSVAEWARATLLAASAEVAMHQGGEKNWVNKLGEHLSQRAADVVDGVDPITLLYQQGHQDLTQFAHMGQLAIECSRIEKQLAAMADSLQMTPEKLRETMSVLMFRLEKDAGPFDAVEFFKAMAESERSARYGKTATTAGPFGKTL